MIERFFKRSKLKSFFLLKDILHHLLPIMSGLNKSAGRRQEPDDTVSEDLIVASCDCLARMLKRSEQDVLEKFYDDEMKLPISHLVMMTLEYVDKHKTLTHVALSSLSLISVLCPERQDEGESTFLDKKFRTLFKQMLPGITTNLMKVMKNNSANLSWKVKVAALESWGDYVIGILSDNCLLYTSPSPRDRQKSRMPSSA